MRRVLGVLEWQWVPKKDHLWIATVGIQYTRSNPRTLTHSLSLWHFYSRYCTRMFISPLVGSLPCANTTLPACSNFSTRIRVAYSHRQKSVARGAMVANRAFRLDAVQTNCAKRIVTFEQMRFPRLRVHTKCEFPSGHGSSYFPVKHPIFHWYPLASVGLLTNGKILKFTFRLRKYHWLLMDFLGPRVASIRKAIVKT